MDQALAAGTVESSCGLFSSASLAKLRSLCECWWGRGEGESFYCSHPNLLQEGAMPACCRAKSHNAHESATTVSSGSRTRPGPNSASTSSPAIAQEARAATVCRDVWSDSCDRHISSSVIGHESDWTSRDHGTANCWHQLTKPCLPGVDSGSA